MNTENIIKKEVVYQYEIQTSDNPYPRVLVINLKAKNVFRSVKHSYRFVSLEQRNLWVERFKKNVESWEQRKLEKKAERKNFENPAKVGDILYSSWGYEQTNIDFYQVLSVKGKYITLREIAQDKKETAWLQGTCTPIADRFVTDAPILRRQVRPGYVVTIDDCSSAWLWDGRTKHWTAYA